MSIKISMAHQISIAVNLVASNIMPIPTGFNRISTYIAIDAGLFNLEIVGIARQACRKRVITSLKIVGPTTI